MTTATAAPTMGETMRQLREAAGLTQLGLAVAIHQPASFIAALERKIGWNDPPVLDAEVRPLWKALGLTKNSPGREAMMAFHPGYAAPPTNSAVSQHQRISHKLFEIGRIRGWSAPTMLETWADRELALIESEKTSQTSTPADAGSRAPGAASSDGPSDTAKAQAQARAGHLITPEARPPQL